MKRNWRADLGQGAIYVALFCLCLLGSWGAWRLPIKRGEVMAAWFQGFGTVAAICLTLAMGFRAENTARAAQLAAKHRFISQIATLAGAAHRLAHGLRAALQADDPDLAQSLLPNCEEITAQFEKWGDLPIQHWPEAALAVSVESLGRAFSQVVQVANRILVQGGSFAQPSQLARMDTYLEVFQSRLERVSQLGELVERRG